MPQITKKSFMIIFKPNFVMPDESCRKCGGLLLDYAVCAKCRATIQFICRICGTKTLEKIHEPICFRIESENHMIVNFHSIRHVNC